MTDHWETEFHDLFEECFDLICAKQRDYGTGNIESFGSAGVLVRLSDKLARLKHLMTSGQQPENESLEDTWKDIVNYGIIGLALERGVVFHPPAEYRIVDTKNLAITSTSVNIINTNPMNWIPKKRDPDYVPEPMPVEVDE